MQTTSPDGVARICARESFDPKPYNDPKGSARWSHGYGTECAADAPPITEDDARAEMAAHLAGDEAAVNRLVKVPLSQHQFDALVSFSYNEGDAALARSTVLLKLNAGDYQGAADHLLDWDKEENAAGELVTSGALLTRRKEERAQFLTSPEAETQPELPTDDEPDSPGP